jgi:hypothetical protein
MKVKKFVISVAIAAKNVQFQETLKNVQNAVKEVICLKKVVWIIAHKEPIKKILVIHVKNVH